MPVAAPVGSHGRCGASSNAYIGADANAILFSSDGNVKSACGLERSNRADEAPSAHLTPGSRCGGAELVWRLGEKAGISGRAWPGR